MTLFRCPLSIFCSSGTPPKGVICYRSLTHKIHPYDDTKFTHKMEKQNTKFIYKMQYIYIYKMQKEKMKILCVRLHTVRRSA